MGRIFVLVAALLCLGAAGCGEDPEAAAIRAVWAESEAAWRTGDGEKIWTLFAQPARDYYDNITRMARETSADQMKRVPVVERYQVLYARCNYSAQELKKLDGHGLIVDFAADYQDLFEPDRLGTIHVHGDVAAAEMSGIEGSIPYYWDFIKENGVWRIDDRRADQRWKDEIHKFQQELRLATEDEAIMKMLEFEFGEKPPKTIWNPPK